MTSPQQLISDVEPPLHVRHPSGTMIAVPCTTISSMPIEEILPLLIAERDKLNRAIEALEGRRWAAIKAAK